MKEFLIAFGAFLILHSIPAIAPIRQGLIDRFGRRSYFIAYSVVSLLVLGWLIHATLYLDYVPLWDPAPWQAWATMVAAPIGIFFVLAGLSSVNPLSLSIRQGFHSGSIVAITRHPVLWGFLIWATAHLVPNGDLGGVLLFAGLALFCVAGFLIVEKRARRRLGDDWDRIAGTTSIVPFRAIIDGRARLSVDAPMASALILTGVLTYWLLAGGHTLLFVAEPLALALPGT
ncbi:NnrU family protein [Phyllobacterium brassicacearum]|uniref:NnrU family protein n=1 Tax=Phyllobacterium brassicacearum TaxID=314235 RepID=A0A2P7B673_9HYPH|nr:NnrU family protein [Phyllobacterium brassicacearum]PSH61977.1 NnrU family protein [Phyllobacterium brassicacearum]TDQ14878.1 putative membrane protein [Phyllobacterium brassicacearum]